ncbi:ADP-ribosylglycohydrolase family protein [Hymenobacter bucti]|uniref:ADP-ribosylglycohydrolase family protein n=1 Tax=Hymenobacter bucti TaxID=1844114 RepID=A0ABW4QT03_9BACT
MSASLLPAARAALLGLAVGDALGVPVEFIGREARRHDPVVGMRGYGTHHQPPGTWSDDSSLTFCLAETLVTVGYDVADVAQRFVRWQDEAYWTAHGKVFDIGIATADALQRLRRGVAPSQAGGRGEYDNGNGSLMRILPLAFASKDWPIAARFKAAREISGITHAHIRAIMACFIYLEVARHLVIGLDKQAAYNAMQLEVNEFFETEGIGSELELRQFHRILENSYGDYVIQPLATYHAAEIKSSGYVVHTLEAALWCLLTHDTYPATVLAAVNLGDDTDTTGAVAGGLAGLAYGEAAIPAEWLSALARRADIEDLAARLVTSI